MAASTHKSSSRVRRSVAGSRPAKRNRVKARGRRPARRPSAARAGHKPPAPIDAEKQRLQLQYEAAVRNYDAAVRAFRRENYDKAAEIFEKLLASGVRDVADRAQVHLRLCKQRITRPPALPKSADELYALGVASLNGRNLELAAAQLGKADKIKPNQDHIRYALAATHALRGEIDAALEHLQAAVTLRPENRFHARRDDDFQCLATDPRFRRLMSPIAS